MNITTSEKIRILCKRYNITISELANRIQTSSQNLSQKLRRDNFTEKELKTIADAMNCEYKSLFITEDGEEF